MELRLLQYFLAVSKQESITRAAAALHMSQPSLSRQMKDLEEELGRQLLIRGTSRTTLTEEGKILRRRAEEIMTLVQLAEEEVRTYDHTSLNAEIRFGAGETKGIQIISAAIRNMRQDYPDIRTQIISGVTLDVCDLLDHGLIDFGVICGEADEKKYHVLKLNTFDTVGILMRKDDPLAKKKKIRSQDLKGRDLIISSRTEEDTGFMNQLNIPKEDYHIAARYTLIYNASVLVQNGIGIAVGFGNLIDVSENSPFHFVPFDPPVISDVRVIWKKNRNQPEHTEIFLNYLKETQSEML